MPIEISGTSGFTNGPYEKPADKEKGNDVFETIEEFMERMATHSHSGADSNEISLNIAKDLEEFINGVSLTWNLLGESMYRASIAVPVATTYDASIRKFLFKDAEHTEWTEFYPTVEKIDDNNFYVYSNDNTMDIKVVTL
jgi:hypothetical protein